MINIRNSLFIVIITIMLLPVSPVLGWGWNAHRYINENAVDFLPAEMSFFNDQRNFLRDHSTDPDTDDLPGYYHYIDIDYYPEFFLGTLPHDLDTLIALYGSSIVNGNGVVPWIIEDWTVELTNAMAGGYWDSAWQIAAELGHYIADSHQALHLTLNYNGQLTGNYGIHSRYETHLTNLHLNDIQLGAGTAEYWPETIDSVFAYIDDIYPYVDMIIAADDSATSVDPSQGDVYYASMWAQLDSITELAINMAVIDVANLWYTAWIDAGSPVLNTFNEMQPLSITLYQNYPNPFNPVTQIDFSLSENLPVILKILDIAGQELAVLENRRLLPGIHSTSWNGIDNQQRPAASGVYLIILQAGNQTLTRKMTLLR